MLITQTALAKPNEFDSENDYIECYWCNSRDYYCGKRVTDTMVTILKCPKTHKCTVYTNPYDNYYLHRGCSFGLDFGEQEIENGCYIEEDGSTYCFCDYNRCNAAGILDLRNLAPELANTTKSMILNDEDFRTTKKLYKTTQAVKSTQKQMEHLIRVPLLENLITKSKLKNENDLLLKKIQEFSGGLPIGSSAIVLNSTIKRVTTTQAPVATTTQTTLKTPKLKFFTDKTRFNQYFSKTHKIEPTSSTSQIFSLPYFIKYKTQFKSKYPKVPMTTTTVIPTTSTTTIIPTTSTTTSTTTTTSKPTSTTTLLTTISKVFSPKRIPNLKLLNNKMEEDFVYTPVSTTSRPVFDWIKAYIEKYNSDNKKLEFKCPSDGLYRHPYKCNQFLQCIYFGTYHERFYVLDCPAGLYFNEKLGYCDYSYNVNC